MEPPNGFKYRPLESKVKKRGPFLIGNLLEKDLNPPSSIDQNFSNFSIGSGRVADDKILEESNLSGVDNKPDDAEIGNLKMEFFSPELSKGAANREIRNFESGKANLTAENQNFKVIDYCSNSDIATEDYCSKSEKTNSDLSGEESVDSYNFVAPKGWTKLSNQQAQDDHPKDDVFLSNKCAKVL